jgi:hypothetical protein
MRTVTSFKIEKKKTFKTKDVMQILETGLSSFVKELFLQLGFSSFPPLYLVRLIYGL